MSDELAPKLNRPSVAADDLADLLAGKGIISEEELSGIAAPFVGGTVHLRDRLRHRWDPKAKAQAEKTKEDIAKKSELERPRADVAAKPPASTEQAQKAQVGGDPAAVPNP